MIGLAMEYAEPAAQIVAWGCRILVQSTLLIALGLAACGVLRRRSATLRSVVLRATLVAVVVCPVVSGWCGLVVVEIPLPSGSGGRSVSTPSARPALLRHRLPYRLLQLPVLLMMLEAQIRLSAL